MKRIKLYIAASIDGYIALPDGNIDWLTSFPTPEATDYGYQELLDSIDTVIMGRNTYDSINEMDISWSYGDKVTYVITRHTGIQADNIKLITDNVIDKIREIKSGTGKDIWLIGGGEIVSLFLQHGLIDEMIISTIPVILGDGIPLFPKMSRFSEWETVSCQTFINGLIKTQYILKSEK